jgi:uncharacterized membrane protein
MNLWTMIIDSLFKLLTIATAMWAIVLIAKDINRRKAEEAKEKSVGAEALKLIKQEIQEMREDISNGKVNEESFKRVVDRLQQDYDFLMKRFFDYFKPTK